MKFLLYLVLSCLALTVRADVSWLTDFAAAQTQAGRENKKLFVDFTGSDWCVPCNRLDQEVFASPEFAAFARDYVLVRLDFPRRKPQSADLKTQNAALREKHRIEAFPTVLILNAGGEPLGRLSGFAGGSAPADYLAALAKSAAK